LSPNAVEKHGQQNAQRPNSGGRLHVGRVDRLSDDSCLGSNKSHDAVQTDSFADGIQTKAVPYSSMQFPLSKGPQGWKKRPRSPGLKWHKDYDTPESVTNGRVLVIDYVKRGRLLQYAETLSNTSGGMDVNQNSRGGTDDCRPEQTRHA
jgi:hypothetical protein